MQPESLVNDKKDLVIMSMITDTNIRLELQYFKDGLGGPLSPKFLSELKNLSGADSFIETGTYFGDTVESVRNFFNNVWSIELSKDLFNKAQVRFQGISHVHLLNGDSAAMLREALIGAGDSTSILWLDAHYSGEGTSRSASNTPIISELDIVSQYGNGREIILIDDVRMFGKVASGFLRHDAIGGYPGLSEVVDIIRHTGIGYDCFVVADILLALPIVLRSNYTVSKVLMAVTHLMLEPNDPERVLASEKIIASAKGEERTTIMILPDLFKQQLLYGLGGAFCYWRSLLHQSEGRNADAIADMKLYRRCLGHEGEINEQA